MTTIQFNNYPVTVTVEDLGSNENLSVTITDVDTETTNRVVLSNSEIEDFVHFLEGKLSRNKRRKDA